MAELNVDVCVLGAGPTGLLCAERLTKKGLRTICVGAMPLGAVATVSAGTSVISPFPIFTCHNSSCVKSLDALGVSVPNLTIRYANKGDFKSIPEASPNSFMAQMLAHRTDGQIPAILAQKQFGEVACTEPLPELHRKVTTKYPAGKNVSIRPGFIHGKSPFHELLHPLVPSLVVHGHLRRLSPRERRLDTDQDSVSYRWLIATIPIRSFHAFFAGDRIPSLPHLVGADAHTHLFETREPITPNILIYDCAIGSPIFRVFTCTDHVALAQTSFPHPAPSHDAIAEHLGRLLNLTKPARKLLLLSAHDCYPLDRGTSSAWAALEACFHDQRITLFGRMAQWRYVDLDDLDWGTIDELAID